MCTARARGGRRARALPAPRWQERAVEPTQASRVHAAYRWRGPARGASSARPRYRATVARRATAPPRRRAAAPPRRRALRPAPRPANGATVLPAHQLTTPSPPIRSFCFSHADEYWALEAAMGIKIPKCMEAASTLNCPKKHDVDLWHQSGLLSKVHLFWGHNDLPLPHEDLPVPTCQQLYAGDAAAIAKHC